MKVGNTDHEASSNSIPNFIFHPKHLQFLFSILWKRPFLVFVITVHLIGVDTLTASVIHSLSFKMDMADMIYRFHVALVLLFLFLNSLYFSFSIVIFITFTFALARQVEQSSS